MKTCSMHKWKPIYPNAAGRNQVVVEHTLHEPTKVDPSNLLLSIFFTQELFPLYFLFTILRCRLHLGLSHYSPDAITHQWRYLLHSYEGNTNPFACEAALRSSKVS